MSDMRKPIIWSNRSLRCAKSAQIRILFWSVFSRIWIEYEKTRAKKALYLDTFHTVLVDPNSSQNHCLLSAILDALTSVKTLSTC